MLLQRAVYEKVAKCKRTYVHEIRKVKKKCSGDSGPAYISHWLFFEILNDSVRHRIFEELCQSRRRQEMRVETESNAAMSFGRHGCVRDSTR